MKPKRIVLVYDNEAEAPIWRCVLETHGFAVLTATSFHAVTVTLANRPVDVLLVGPKADDPLEPNAGLGNTGNLMGVRVIARDQDHSVMDVCELLRIAVHHKRGPKTAVAVMKEGAA